MAEGLSYGGLNLAGPALTARDLSGLLSLPERRGENVPVPGRHGAVRTPRKRYGGRVAPFEILVRGFDYATGAAATSTEQARELVAANLDLLGRALALDEAPLVHTMADESTRSVLAEARGAVDATRDKSGVLATVKVAFESASAFWRADTPTVASVALANGGTGQLAELDGCTAPIDDALIVFGPGDPPRLTDLGSGTWVAYDTAIGGGRTLRLDCAEWEGAGTGGLVFDRTKLRTTPGVGRWLELTPTVGGPLVQLTHANAGAMDVTVTARKAWMFG